MMTVCVVVPALLVRRKIQQWQWCNKIYRERESRFQREHLVAWTEAAAHHRRLLAHTQSLCSLFLPLMVLARVGGKGKSVLSPAARLGAWIADGLADFDDWFKNVLK
jgi:hypothetical protein